MDKIILLLSICFIVGMLGCTDSSSSGIAGPSSSRSSSTTSSEETGDADTAVEEAPNERVVVEIPPHEEQEEQVVVAAVPLKDKKLNQLTDNQKFAFLVLGPGTRIIVQNSAKGHGLHVREPAGLHLGDANIIGHMLNGATGTVLSEAKIVGELIWLQIEWDKEAEGRCRLNAEGRCIGWSAAVSAKDARFLDLIE